MADRGRLPAEVTDAYRASTGGAKKVASTKAAPAKKAASTKAAPVKKSAPAKPSVRSAPAKTPLPQDKVEAPTAAAAVEKAVVQPPAPEQTAKPSPVTDDRRLVALGEEIKALTLRVEALEKAASSKSSMGKSNPFRRRS